MVVSGRWLDIQNFNIGPVVDVVYLDYRKAFDSVPYNKLLYMEVWHYRGSLVVVQGLPIRISSRTQCVRVNGHLLGILPVVSGVPQGSIPEHLI